MTVRRPDPHERYDDRYGRDAVAAGLAARAARRVAPPELAADPGVVVEHPEGFVGAVVECDAATVTLADRAGRRRVFPLGVFLVDGDPVTLVRPRPAAGPAGAGRTAAGALRVRHDARVARASRILVEGTHDAGLVEKVWGDDLRELGVVVEILEGVDHLAAIAGEFRPGPGRRLGVLVDHLVAGSKEARVAAAVSAEHAPHVLVTGHPYVDVWAAVRPARVGLTAWPQVPRGEDWKTAVTRALGEPDPATAWRRVLASVRTWADLETPLITAVEQLVDHVSAG